MPRRLPGSIATLVACLWLPGRILAATPDLHPLEPPDTSSPRATMQSFLGAMQEASRLHSALLQQYRREPGLSFSPSAQEQFDRLTILLNRAGRCLDVSAVAPTLTRKVRLESTLLLKEIADRIDLPPLESVPDAEAMTAAGLERWRIPQTEIVIAKVNQGEHAGEYLFSPATIDRLPEFYETVRHLPYKPGSWEKLHEFFTTIGVARYIPWKVTDRLPAWAKAQLWEQALWRWIVLGLALVVAFAGLIPISRWTKRTSGTAPLRRYLRRIVMPVFLSIVASLLMFVVDATNVTGAARNVIASVIGAAFLLAVAWGMLLLGRVAGEVIAASPAIRARSIDESLARLGSRIVGFALALAVLLYGVQLLGLPVVPLLAGLGVGGLALALAAQQTIENLIAGLTLYADRPVRVGDFCRFGQTVGTVETIGLRSTHIRTLDNTVVSIPNAEFSKSWVENFSRRDKLWYHPRIRLRYETTPDQIRYILVEIHKILFGHPKVIPDAARVRFIEFGEYSLDLEVFAYVDVKDYAQYLEVSEDLNLRIIDVVKAAGAELAVPALVDYQVTKEPPSEDRIRKAESQVSEWRAGGALYLPKFPPEKIAELRGSLDYPPAGSPSDKSGAR